MYKFKFADIGEGIHEGQLLKWLFKEGDEVKDGDTLCLVETDKVNAEIPSPVDGKIAKIFADVGDTIHVGEVLVNIDDGTGEDEADQTAEQTTEKPEDTTEDNDDNVKMDSVEEEEASGVVGELEVSSEVIESSDENTRVSKTKEQEKVLATPVARKLAKDLGIDIRTIKGTGEVGRVMKEDIEKAKAAQGEQTGQKQTTQTTQIDVPKPDVSGEVERVKISRLRKTIAKNMSLSNSIIPHAATMDDYDVTKLVEFRKQQKQLAKDQGINLTYMPFIIKAITIVLKEFPIFNSSFDHETDELLLKKYYNIGIAVDTEEGLIVPVIKDADRKSILEIAKELQELSEKARDRKLSLDSLQGGTFTITNYGAFGSTYGVPVIKHPETAIIGIGKIDKKPVVRDDEIVIRSMMPVSICIDHRVIDGGDAGRFLMRLKAYLNDPMFLLLN